jgi:glycerol-3-phosphate dehydrogenase
VKGSHLLLRRPGSFGNDAIIIRSVGDGRPLWVIPWETRLIVGSTERRYHGDLRDVRPDADEIDDLWTSFLHYFPHCGLGRGDICAAYAGVRPIVEQAGDSDNSLSRKYEILSDQDRRLVTVNGGKLTTFRRMAEKTVDAVVRMMGRCETDGSIRERLRGERLWPGVDRRVVEQLTAQLTARANGRIGSASVIAHLARFYGRDAEKILDAAATGQTDPIYPGLPYCLAELAYLWKTEYVHHLLDLLKRRTSIYFLADRGGIDSLPAIVEVLRPLHQWSDHRIAEEIESVEREFRADCAALHMTAAMPERGACRADLTASGT